MAQALNTAFGKTIPVTVLHTFWHEATEEMVVVVVLPSGLDATVKQTSLVEAAPLPAQYEQSANPVTEPGMYVDGDDIYKVQKSKESGNLYAKRLVRIGGTRLAEDGGRVKHEFQYAPGAVKALDASKRMTLEQAKAFGIEYGVCCVCGAFLKDADSVAAGIGPVCAGRV